MTSPPRSKPRILVIGAGFSGICLGIQLRKAGFHDFVLLEKEPHLGGTWRDNTYPGAACDSPSFAYCFSFEQKTDWSRKWAPQEEILGYLEHCAQKYGLHPHLRLGTEVESARFDETAGVWHVRSTTGERFEAEVLVASVGQLNRPAIPPIPGLGRFRGACFHSARWDASVSLDGRRVAVIGNAASAIQLVPEVAKRAARLHVFQRSANWMLPRRDRAYGESERRRFTRHPWLARLYRWWIWAMFELRFPVFRRNAFLSQRLERFAIRAMREQVSDPALQEALIPDYPIGGKRILISDDYYPTLQQEHVELVTTPIDHLTEDAIVTSDGRERPVDVAILATGFQTTEFLVPMRIQGLDGETLESAWKDGARAYLGLSTPGFPNFFMTYGPNTNLGHNSIIFMIECQTRYIVSCLEQMATRNLLWIDVRRDVMAAFEEKLQRELARTAWAAPERSWYKNEAGRITNNWSGSTIRYWWRTRRADLSVYRLQHRRRGRADREAPTPAPAAPARGG